MQDDLDEAANFLSGLPAAPDQVFLSATRSEVARRLRETRGFSTPHLKAPLAAMFAALLREVGYSEKHIHRIIDGDLKREVVPELGQTWTLIQQALGTEFGRNCIRPDIWADLWGQRADRILGWGGRVALEGVRFENEALAVRNRGGVLVEIRRPGVGPESGHVSEAIPAVPDLILENYGALAELHERVDALVEG